MSVRAMRAVALVIAVELVVAIVLMAVWQK